MVTKLTKPAKSPKATKAASDAQPSARKKSEPGKKAKGKKKSDSLLSSSVKDSAQQIWQAGLGAFTKAQTEGTKAFEALVKEGASFQRKPHTTAEERISEAAQRMTSMATDISSRASGQWDKLENIFEDRVAKVLHKMGVPSAKDIDVLIARMDALNASVQKLSPGKTTAKTTAKTATVTKASANSPTKSPVEPAVTSSVKPAVKPASKLAVKAVAKPAVKAARKKAVPLKVAAAKVT